MAARKTSTAVQRSTDIKPHKPTTRANDYTNTWVAGQVIATSHGYSENTKLPYAQLRVKTLWTETRGNQTGARERIQAVWARDENTINQIRNLEFQPTNGFGAANNLVKIHVRDLRGELSTTRDGKPFAAPVIGANSLTFNPNLTNWKDSFTHTWMAGDIYGVNHGISQKNDLPYAMLWVKSFWTDDEGESRYNFHDVWVKGDAIAEIQKRYPNHDKKGVFKLDQAVPVKFHCGSFGAKATSRGDKKYANTVINTSALDFSLKESDRRELVQQ